MEYRVSSNGRFGLTICKWGEVSVASNETADASPTPSRPCLDKGVLPVHPRMTGPVIPT